ncbi:MAG: hypothetical protein KGN16_13130 [Burkholderiales bacterium]|nr:hypothetical protein [Burkholderiales bacterium]
MIIDTSMGICTDRYDDDVVAALAQARRRRTSTRPIAFYGSSSFRFWRSLAADLGRLDVVNLGFGGGTFASGIHYLETLLLPFSPHRIVLYFGENDISNDGLSAEATLRHLVELIARIRRALPEAGIYLLAAKQSPAKWIYADTVDAFNTLACARCKELGVVFIDGCSLLLGETGRPMFRYFEPDLIHLNASGYARWAALLSEVLGAPSGGARLEDAPATGD